MHIARQYAQGRRQQRPVHPRTSLLDNVADLRLKAHVEHAVRLVEDEVPGGIPPMRYELVSPRATTRTYRGYDAHLTWRSDTMPRPIMSARRPGVATSTSQPLRTSSICVAISAPPYTTHGWIHERYANCGSVVHAHSRQGQRTAPRRTAAVHRKAHLAGVVKDLAGQLARRRQDEDARVDRLAVAAAAATAATATTSSTCERVCTAAAAALERGTHRRRCSLGTGRGRRHRWQRLPLGQDMLEQREQERRSLARPCRGEPHPQMGHVS